MAETPGMSIYEKAFAKSDVTDAILVVQGKKLHVNKTFLSIHSDYFKALFNSDFKEKSMEEIPIEDVEFEHFATLLSLVHPNRIEPQAHIIKKLLELADRFLLPVAKRHLEMFLMATNNFAPTTKIEYADEFDLADLLEHALRTFIDRNSFLTLPSSFSQLKEKTKVNILNRFLSTYARNT